MSQFDQKYNQPQSLIQKLALLLRQASFWFFLMLFGNSFGQVYVLDSSVFIQGEATFIAGEIYSEDNILIEDSNDATFHELTLNEDASQAEEVDFNAHNAPQVIVETVKSEQFVRQDKPSDHSLINYQLRQSLAVISSYSSKNKILFVFSNEIMPCSGLLSLDKIIDGPGLKDIQQPLFSISARSPPSIL